MYKEREIEIEYLPPFQMDVQLPITYPSHTFPIFKLHGGFYSAKFPEIKETLKSFWMDGIPVLYQWYEYLKNEFLESSPVDLTKQVSTPETFQEIQNLSKEHFILQFQNHSHVCNICCETRAAENMMILSACTHYFCKYCLKEQINFYVMNNELDKIICSECLVPIAECDMRELVSEELMERYKKFLLQRDHEKKENAYWCPNLECGAPVIAKNSYFGQCDLCWYKFCLLCKTMYHGTRRCQTAIVERISLDIEKLDQT